MYVYKYIYIYRKLQKIKESSIMYTYRLPQRRDGHHSIPRPTPTHKRIIFVLLSDSSLPLLFRDLC